ncbi:hypothetical protein [Actinomadura parmotrematis]|uniref:Transposase n=1 Tax=Actinomadura parmotrematis TaxID=2864039 RepID=A0ABS7FWC3_9ACTN|nr:hypothetical protein [Actinomadura parmotrematis]MBW8484275.1 hypothetical protein [Actinomadura parmotrematis]
MLRTFLLWTPETPRTLSELVKILGGLCGLLKQEMYAAVTTPARRRSQMRLALLADEMNPITRSLIS